MTTYLVTGAAGFIGSALVRQLTAGGGKRVVSVDAFTYAADPERLRAAGSASNHRLVKLDINDVSGMTALLAEERPMAIFHLAAETHVDRSIDGPRAFLQANTTGTFNLLESVRRYWETLPPSERAAFRMVNVSTDEVYGSLGPNGTFDEGSPYDPRSPYSASKAGADHFANAYFHTFGLPVMTTHASNNYGPFQFPEKLVPLAISRALAGESVPMYGDGMQVRDWLHVDDHARGLVTVVERGEPGATYLMGGGHELPNRILLEQLLGHLNDLVPGRSDHRLLIKSVTDRPGHDRRYAVDSSRAENELGWRRLITFDDGLRDTVQWYVENQAWVRAVTERYDLGRLGLGANPTGARSV
ncbi:MAG: dTDP-glucose 4,6-dehydratase [Trueperaceae bacterium]|nr:dTDP-glucose 4,6-dehydratase [Trueperaceae bacterium]MCO5174930.1 dTDP-glucose 4,6-dehydratase [Trueperaceae bacterium]MCW5820398.1 dTDP-glucose 4,6-dehydratase [Trueperaceae bacterium]